jgi:hypothetical protein
MILMGHRVRGEVDRRAIVAHVEAAGESEHLLVVRFDESDRAIEELGKREAPVVVYRARRWRLVACFAASFVLAFAALTAWVH